MATDLSRRDFVKKTAAASSLLAVGTRSVARGFPANEKVQLGWIGIGGRQASLQAAMVQHCSADARTIAVCDLIPDRVETGKKRAEPDKPTGYTNMYEMMEKEKLDGILVITQPSAHAEVAAPVLEHGFHCFAEKPVDTTVEKVDVLVKAARAAAEKGVFYQVGTQRRYSVPHLKAMEIIHSGRLGPVMFMQGHWHWSWRPGPRRVSRDGGFLVEQASHHTDVMSWAMNDTPPSSCLASGRIVVDAPEGPNIVNEQQSAVIWTWPTGQIFSYTHMMYLARRFQDEKLWVHCQKAGVEVNHGVLHNVDENWMKAAQPLDVYEERFAEDVGEDWGMGTTEELQGFVANIKSGGKLPVNASIETGRVSTLMTIMGRMAMVNAAKNVLEPSVVTWKDLHSATDLA